METSPRETNFKYGLTVKDWERRTPLRGKEIIGHSNGVRLISNNATISWIIERMKHWDINRIR
jgi:hypothetical protein